MNIRKAPRATSSKKRLVRVLFPLLLASMGIMLLFMPSLAARGATIINSSIPAYEFSTSNQNSLSIDHKSQPTNSLSISNFPFQNSLEGIEAFSDDVHFPMIWSSNNVRATQSVAYGDFDGDGDLDLVVGNSEQANFVYQNDGTGNLSLIWESDDSKATQSVAIGDMDGDGDLILQLETS